MEIKLNKWQSVLLFILILSIGFFFGWKNSPKEQINVIPDRVLARSLVEYGDIVYERMPNPDATNYSARHKITDNELQDILKIPGIQHAFVGYDSSYTIGVFKSAAFQWSEVDSKIIEILEQSSVGFNETLTGNVEATTDISDNLMDLSDITSDSTEAIMSITDFETTNTVMFYLGDNNEELLFTWEDGKFRVKYPEGKLDESGKKFVEWLEQYMNEDYCKNKKD